MPCAAAALAPEAPWEAYGVETDIIAAEDVADDEDEDEDDVAELAAPLLTGAAPTAADSAARGPVAAPADANAAETGLGIALAASCCRMRWRPSQTRWPASRFPAAALTMLRWSRNPRMDAAGSM